MSAGGPAFLPYGRQEVDAGDVAAVAEALRGDLITQGPVVERFERAFAEYVGARHAVAFSSGTAALHGAAHAVGVGPGDRCVTAPITFAASMNCGVYLGGTPIFSDIDPATWCLDPHAAAAIEDARMIVPVSFAGLPADLEPLRATGARIVEDAAHALGALRDGRPVGGPGGADVTCFSLHPVKAMTTGEGGMATTEDDELAERLRTFRTHGIRRGAATTPGPHDGAWYYEQQELGFNYRITDFQCALGLRQLERLEGWVLRRNALAEQYRELLADDAERVALPPAAPAGSRHAHHLFVVHFAGGAPVRRRLFDGLRAAGIGVQVHYIPLHRMPYYRDTWDVPQDAFGHSDAYYAGALSLPMFPGLTEDDVVRVVDDVRRLLDE
ncbi:UDP-4-amino-4,6-dideoxy-N-acetyl-beta-L-altrosamine transaminase [Baekduia sp. Peel2402]|uniref:UDP-4-amino-4, 6-dideoxy-N-acetyl-beta-L-altrosamine transaminase n=1 Tax=Baekduia sp. Peel2402 TaxID=3458296 RepID=UPI00403E4B94